MRRPLIFLILFLVLAGGLFLLFKKQKTPDGASTGASVFQRFFSRENDGSQATNTVPTEDPSIEVPDLAATSKFTLMSPSSIAGYVAFNKTRTITVPSEDPKQKPTIQTVTEHFIRYVARSNGYVYEIKEGGSITQISNTYIPNVYEATFTADGKTAIVRFLREDDRTIASYSIPIPDQNPDGTRTQQAGSYFPDGVRALALSGDSKTLAYISPLDRGVSIVTSDTKNVAKKEVYQTPFTGWLPLWSNNVLYLQTKATAYASGFLYKVDTTTKRLLKVLGDIPGLTATISPKGDYILYSESVPDGFVSKLLSVKTGGVKTLGITILPEKCAWLMNQNLICAGGTVTPAPYPDAWYAGTINLSGGLYFIYPPDGSYDIVDAGDEWSYDAVALQIDESLRLIYFIDRPTGLLWQFKY